MTRIKIVHIITGLNPDGAETMLSRLVASLDPDRFVSEIISLTNLGDLGETVRRTWRACASSWIRAKGWQPVESLSPRQRGSAKPGRTLSRPGCTMPTS